MCSVPIKKLELPETQGPGDAWVPARPQCSFMPCLAHQLDITYIGLLQLFQLDVSALCLSYMSGVFELSF